MACTPAGRVIRVWDSKGRLDGKTVPLLVDGHDVEDGSSSTATPSDTGSTASTEHRRPDEIQQGLSWQFWGGIMLSTSLWWVASLVVTLTIKSTTALPDGVYPHAFAFTILVSLTTGGVAWLLAKVLHRGKPPLPPMERSEFVKVLALGLVQGMEIALANKALQFLSVASRTMLNSMNVLFMMTTAWGWGLETLDWRRAISCTLFIGGGVLEGRDPGLAGGSNFAAQIYTLGFCLQLASMFCRSQRWALTQCVLQLSPLDSALGQMSKLQLLSRMLPVAGLVCAPLVFCLEPTAFTADQLLQAELPIRVLFVAVGLTAMHYAELTLVKELSAVTFNVLSTVHQIPVVLVGFVFLHNRVSETAVSGFAMCLLAALVYAWARSAEVRSQRKAGRA